MNLRLSPIRTGRDWSSWPVLLLLLTALVPSAGVVWMLRAALDSEQLAVRQRLADAYRAQLDRAASDIADHWRELLGDLGAADSLTPSRAFTELVDRTDADGIVVWDPAGRVAYPDSPEPPELVESPAAWNQAERLEFWEQNPAAAAEAYGRIAAGSAAEQVKARAEQAQARCLVRAGEKQAALAVLGRLSQREGVDASGRSLAADARLRLLELTEPKSAGRREAARRLTELLNNYDDAGLSADQRGFLMHRVRELAPKDANFPLLGAEDLAAEFVAAGTSRSEASVAKPSGVEGVWSLTSADGRITALYRTDNLKSQLRASAIDQAWPESVSVSIRAPGESSEVANELMAISLAPTMPGWGLHLQAAGDAAVEAATSGRRTLLLSIATVLVGATVALTGVVANGVRRQMQLARLKNDLVATVSHELKTPLASIRLLVDTLLDDDRGVAGEHREYLELISQENARLTRLIDNFLTFSRLERGKQRFAFQSIDGREVVSRAAAAVADRFNGEHAKLHVELDGPLPVCGDMDALVTAVINLLDNAWKYRGESKEATIRGSIFGDRVLLEVADQGIGLNPRAVRRVFDRFYQADERLSRQHGGCGLGLSIVKSIVDAHGGDVAVTSTLGHGSTFSISLPKACVDEPDKSHQPADEPALPMGGKA